MTADTRVVLVAPGALAGARWAYLVEDDLLLVADEVTR